MPMAAVGRYIKLYIATQTGLIHRVFQMSVQANISVIQGVALELFRSVYDAKKSAIYPA